MKHFTLSLIAAVIALGALNATAQVTKSTRLPAHPRLLLLAGEEQQLKADIDADQYWSQAHGAIMKKAAALIGKAPLERTIKGNRLLYVSRDNLQHIFFLSYAYRMTGDKQYLNQAKAEMNAACDFVDWHPSHFLDVAEMTMAIAIGYDWLYNDLTKAERKKFSKAIINKGLKPSFLPENTSHFDRLNSNWNQVCHASLTFGALAVWEDDRDEAAEIVNRAIKNITIPMKGYEPDGAYPEGAMYWEYGSEFNCMLLAALEKAFGTDFDLTDNAPGFMNTGNYYLNMFTPALNCFNYSDNDLSTTYYSAAIFWFYNKTRNPAILYNESKKAQSRGLNSLQNNRLAPALLIWGAKAPLKGIPEPEQLFYKGNGTNAVAAMRSSWKGNVAWYVGAKYGTPNAPHGHMDVGSFFVERQGVLWAADLGLENYITLEQRGVGVWNKSQNSTRWDVARYNPNYHNIITFDHAKQIVAAKADILRYSDQPDNMSVTADLTPLYQGQIANYERTIALVDKARCEVTDIITTSKATTMTWNMISKVQEATQVSDRVVKLYRGGKNMYLVIDTNLPITWDIAQPIPDKDYENQNKEYIAIRFNAKLKPNQNITIKATLTQTPPTM